MKPVHENLMRLMSSQDRKANGLVTRWVIGFSVVSIGLWILYRWKERTELGADFWQEIKFTPEAEARLIAAHHENQRRNGLS